MDLGFPPQWETVPGIFPAIFLPLSDLDTPSSYSVVLLLFFE
jgi:hypothetical protein